MRAPSLRVSLTGVASLALSFAWPVIARADDAPITDEPRTAEGGDAPGARERDRAAASSFGLVASLRRSPPSKRSPWWLRKDLGPPDPGSPLARAFVASIGDAAGAPGLSLSSAGRGGEERVATAPPGRIATVGNGDGVDDLHAYDHGSSTLTAAHVARTTAEAGGRTPPEVIQRIIRANFGQLEVCYEAGLRTRPTLAGRIAVRFTIDRRGAVAMASDGGSDLDDPFVVACVVRAFDALVFPASSDSAVTVVYPVVFAPREVPR